VVRAVALLASARHDLADAEAEWRLASNCEDSDRDRAFHAVVVARAALRRAEARLESLTGRAP
jgi:Tfp pilus assembly protein PilX